ncbi:hypothetical protein Ancab_015979 [Ancistrocladus abbreviatus]
MADGDSIIKPKRLVSSPISQNKQNPSKFYSHFLFKALIATIFLVLIPIFPSQAPDFISQSVFTRSWELLHLIFVGIAVSYGLFSRRNDDSGGENESKFDNAQSYVSKFLHFSSVFDEEVDSQSGSDDNSKVQTWSSQYFRNEPPMVVLAKGNSAVDEKGNSNAGIAEKPLLLPVRSLKSRVLDGNDVELVDGENSEVSKSFSRSNSSLNSKKTRNGSFKSRGAEGSDFGYLNGDRGGSGSVSNSNSATEEFSKKSRNVSLKSRFDANDFVYANGDDGVSRCFSTSDPNLSSVGSSSSPSKKTVNEVFETLDGEELVGSAEESVVLPSPIPWRSRSGRMEVKEDLEGFEFKRSFRSQSSRSLLSESQAKNFEDGGRRKSIYMSSPPPPPPLPPVTHKSPLVKSSSSLGNDEMSSVQNDSRRSIWGEPMDLNQGEREDFLSRGNARTEAKARSQIDGSLAGKSVRTPRASDMIVAARKASEVAEDGMFAKMEKRSKEGETEKKADRTAARYDTTNENIIHERNSFGPKGRSFSDYPKETRDFLERVMAETDDDDDDFETEDDSHGKLKAKEDGSNDVNEAADVDKMADEFIAKFREQIRLQRIDSIKRSTGQLKKDSVR